ncbi:MAG: alpha-L-glutamate ligase-like protein [bacterium]|nr:alpha-L-glutamate ligase-like protein [bacterium]
MIAALARLPDLVLGINRRNHDYLFRFNRRDRFALVDDKIATKERLAAHDVPHPPALEVCDAPWRLRELAPRLRAHGAFAMKPACGAGGGGIVVVVGLRDGRFETAGGRTLDWRELAAHAADVLAGVYSMAGREDRVLVEGLVVGDPELARLSYRGVPDLRVVVLRGVPLLAMLRLPTRRSDGRANLHLGGLGVGIDLASGRTTTAISGRREVTMHPDLGVPLAGTVIPGWDQALRTAVRAADAIGLGFVGVDLVLDAAHGPLVLELNARPGLAIQLANRRGMRPLLERVAQAAVPPSPEARIALGRALVAE